MVVGLCAAFIVFRRVSFRAARAWSLRPRSGSVGNKNRNEEKGEGMYQNEKIKYKETA